MIHQRQRLALRFESRDHLTRVHPQFDHFDRDGATDRLALLGLVDRAHSAFADQLLDEVRPDLRRIRLIPHRREDVGELLWRVPIRGFRLA